MKLLLNIADFVKSCYIPPVIRVEEFQTEKGFADSGTEDYEGGGDFGNNWD